MKASITILLSLFLLGSIVTAQDTLYIYKNGHIIKRSALTDIDSIAFSKNVKILPAFDVYDIDGNGYHIVTLGTQKWLKENLKVERYQNGDPIETSPYGDISSDTTPDKYQWAKLGSLSYANLFGRFYTWYASTDNRGVCPAGWHLPSAADWTSLTDYLTSHGYGYQGSGDDIAKSMADTSIWFIGASAGNPGNDILSNNSSGFTGRPAGIRFPVGDYQLEGRRAMWWSSTELPANVARISYIDSDSSKLIIDSALKLDGLSIRCIKEDIPAK